MTKPMSETQELFQYCDENNLNNKFIDSLNEQFNENGELSQKQVNTLNSMVLDHQILVKYFKTVKEENSFVKSLKNFFETRGFLTPKQKEKLFKK